MLIFTISFLAFKFHTVKATYQKLVLHFVYLLNLLSVVIEHRCAQTGFKVLMAQRVSTTNKATKRGNWRKLTFTNK